MTMNPYAQATFITSILSISLGTFVLLRDRHQKLYRAFSLHSFAIGCWAVLSGLHTVVPSAKLALFLGRVEHIPVIFIPIFFLQFVLILTNRLEKDKTWVYSAYLFGLFIFLLVPASVFITRVAPDPPLLQVTRAGPLYIFVVIFFYLYVSRSLFLLFKEYTKSRGEEKKKLGYLFWALMIGYLGGPSAFLYVLDVPHPRFLGYIIYTIPAYIFITTYAIVKHRLLDINVVFKRGLIYSILAASITLIYLIVVWFFERIFQTAIGYQSLPMTFLALLTIALLFQPLKNRIQRFMDLRFFKGTLESLIEEKQKLQEEIRRTDQLRIAGILAASLAHEIKNPLTSIKTFSKYVLERRSDDSFIEKFEEVIENEAGRIEDLVRNLLDFSRPRSPKFKRIDIHNILGQTLRLIEHDFSTKDICVNQLYNEF